MDVLHVIDNTIAYLQECSDADERALAELRADGADKAIVQAGLIDYRRVNELIGQLKHFRTHVMHECDGDDESAAKGAKFDA